MINKVEIYCQSLLANPRIQALPFHDQYHTLEVVENVRFLASQLNFNETETALVTIMAWFHDVGFSMQYMEHEEKGAELAESFLKKEGFDSESIGLITSGIMATRMPQSPQNLLEQVLCDADLFHISNDHFFYRKLLLRREWELVLNKRHTDIEWHELNHDFLKEHHFHSPYGRNDLEEGKQKNLQRVKRLIATYSVQCDYV